MTDFRLRRNGMPYSTGGLEQMLKLNGYGAVVSGVLDYAKGIYNGWKEGKAVEEVRRYKTAQSDGRGGVDSSASVPTLEQLQIATHHNDLFSRFFVSDAKRRGVQADAAIVGGTHDIRRESAEKALGSIRTDDIGRMVYPSGMFVQQKGADGQPVIGADGSPLMSMNPMIFGLQGAFNGGVEQRLQQSLRAEQPRESGGFLDGLKRLFSSSDTSPGASNGIGNGQFAAVDMTSARGVDQVLGGLPSPARPVAMASSGDLGRDAG